MPPKARTKAAAPTEPDADEVPANEPTPVDDTEETAGDGQLSDKDGTVPESVGTPQGSAPDEPGPGETTDGGEVPQTGMVDLPCRKCFPDGWPTTEPDAFVNCGHGFGIRYGDQVEITRERAVELGFLNDKE